MPVTGLPGFLKILNTVNDMPEQITLYNDINRISPFCHRVELALQEAGISHTTHSFDVLSRPAWYNTLNPWTGKVPSITYGGPNVPPEEPSPLSSKITESCVILEFLADVFLDAHLLPPVSDPGARFRVRLFIDTVVRHFEAPLFECLGGIPNTVDKVVEGVLKVQALLPDPDAAGSGEYAIGKEFTNADSAIAPFLGLMDITTTHDLGRFEPGTGKKLEAALAGEQFERLRRYKRALWARESVKKVVDLDHIEVGLRKVLAKN